MSVTSISGSSAQLAGIQNQYQQIRSQFKQLGRDIQSGSLTQAQTDFVTLSQSVSSLFSGTNPLGQTLNKIGQALQSGNLSAAQQALASLTNIGPSTGRHHSHVPPMAEKLTQSLNQLSQALQSGDLSSAQQAFAAVQQVWTQRSGGSLTSGGTSAGSSTTNISV